MEDGIERSLHSLLENQEKIFEQPNENQKKEEQSKILYLCYPNSDEFNLIKCIITDKKEIVRNLSKNGYNVSLFIMNSQYGDEYFRNHLSR